MKAWPFAQNLLNVISDRSYVYLKVHMVFEYPFYPVNVKLIFVPFLFIDLMLNNGKD